MRALAAVVARLRSEGGCPWDRAQTAETLRPYVLEEAYEVLEAIDARDARRLREELGDLLFQVVLQSQIASERGDFDLAAVADTIREKIVRRHPHVFGDGHERAADAAAVEKGWEDLKRAERAERGERDSALAGVPAALPALAQAQKVQERAARVGFDWERVRDVFSKLDEERRELAVALEQGDPAAIEHEVGDLLFTVVNLARFAKVNAEDALRVAVSRFRRRFSAMEEAVQGTGRTLRELTPGEMDALWDAAKRMEPLRARRRNR